LTSSRHSNHQRLLHQASFTMRIARCVVPASIMCCRLPSVRLRLRYSTQIPMPPLLVPHLVSRSAIQIVRSRARPQHWRRACA
jgi:hypothetical protein